MPVRANAAATSTSSPSRSSIVRAANSRCCRIASAPTAASTRTAKWSPRKRKRNSRLRRFGGGPPMPRIAFLFPGQGAQTLGMGRQPYETVLAAKQLFDEASEVLGYDLADVCWNGPAERLNSTAVSQPAIFVASLAALEALKANDPNTVAACQ